MEPVRRLAQTAFRWARRHVLATASWSRRQPRARLVAFAIGALVATFVAWWTLQALIWAVVGLVGWIIGLFSSDTPGAPQAPAPPSAPKPAPEWLVDIGNVSLWERLYRAVAGYADQHAAGAGMSSGVLLIGWTALGAILLLACWFSRSSRRRQCVVAWWAWLAATTWVIWVSTPGGNPVPAALTAALGVTLSVVPWMALPIAAVIALGFALP